MSNYRDEDDDRFHDLEESYTADTESAHDYECGEDCDNEESFEYYYENAIDANDPECNRWDSNYDSDYDSDFDNDDIRDSDANPDWSYYDDNGMRRRKESFMEHAANSVGNHGWTYLMIAAHEGYIDITEDLIANSADVNCRSDNGTTALMFTAYAGQRNVAIILLRSGADVNLVNDAGWTALMFAVLGESHSTVRALLNSGADCNVCTNTGWSALMLAASQGSQDIVDLLAKSGADVNYCDELGMTALMIAAQSGHKNIAELLIRNHADLESLDNEGYTALMHAAISEKYNLTMFLSESCAKVYACDDISRNALLKAAEKFQLSNLGELFPLSENEKDLLDAAENGALDLLEECLLQGANVDSFDMFGTTALMFAAQGGHESIIDVLLNHGASLEAKAVSSETALTLAAAKGEISAVKMLVAAGANIDSENEYGDTALAIAVDDGNYSAVLELIELGANINELNYDVYDEGELIDIYEIDGEYNVIDPIINAGPFDIAVPILLHGDRQCKTLKADGCNERVGRWSKVWHDKGKKVLERALREGHEETVKALVALGIYSDECGNEVEAKLLNASINGDMIAFRDSLAKKVNINKVYNDGKTALIFAVINGHSEIVKELVRAGADINAKSKYSKSVLEHAFFRKTNGMYDLLIELGAKKIGRNW